MLDNFERDYFSQRMRLKHTKGNRREANQQSVRGLMIPIDDIHLLLQAFGEDVTEHQVLEFVRRQHRYLTKLSTRELLAHQSSMVLQHGESQFL